MSELNPLEKRQKLRRLASSEGMTVTELLEHACADSVSPAICTEPECDYTTDMEPDQDAGWCENCDKNTVASALILAGVI